MKKFVVNAIILVVLVCTGCTARKSALNEQQFAAEKEALQSQLAEAEEKNQKLSDELTALKKTLQEKESALSETKEKLNKQTDERTVLERECKKFYLNLKDTNEQLNTANVANDTLTAKLAVTIENLENAEQEISILQKKVEEKEQLLTESAKPAEEIDSTVSPVSDVTQVPEKKVEEKEQLLTESAKPAEEIDSTVSPVSDVTQVPEETGYKSAETAPEHSDKISLNVSSNSVGVGETVHVKVSAPGADAIRVYRNDKLRKQGDGDSLEFDISYKNMPSGSQETIYATASYNEVWSDEKSNTETVTVGETDSEITQSSDTESENIIAVVVEDLFDFSYTDEQIGAVTGLRSSDVNSLNYLTLGTNYFYGNDFEQDHEQELSLLQLCSSEYQRINSEEYC